jgi:hypothetical protein
VTWKEYETGLEDRLADLHGRVHRLYQEWERIGHNPRGEFIFRRLMDDNVR